MRQTQAVIDRGVFASDDESKAKERIVMQEGIEQIPHMAQAGACDFKISMFNTDSFRIPGIDDGHLYEAFDKIAETGCHVGVMRRPIRSLGN
ncbi:MAG: allantoinase [Brevibacillus sp.]|nr:allantoinase [Brevibacillus sp.]